MEISGLISLAILAIVIGFILYVVILLVDRIPMDETFKSIAKAAIVLVAVLIILLKLLPLIGVSV